MKTNLKLSLIPVLIFAVSCSSAHFAAVGEDGVVDQGKDAQQDACELDPVAYNLQTDVYSFQVKDNASVSFGFNLNGLLKVLGLSMTLTTGEMDLNMTAIDPLHPETDLANVEGVGPWSATGGSATFGFSQIGVGISFYNQTPLATMSQRGLQDGFSKVIAKLNTYQTPWKTNVEAIIDDNNMILPVGAVAGLKNGDQFAVYNIHDVWSGAPCASELLATQKLSAQPVAILTAVDVQETATIVQISSRNLPDAILPGALVQISQLVKANAKDVRTLLKPIRLTKITSDPIMVDNMSVDITPYMQQQLGPIVTAGGFYLHQ